MAKEQPKTSLFPQELKGILLLGSALFLFLSLISFKAEDMTSNWLGLAGWSTGFALTYLFGLCSFFFCPFFAWWGWKLLIGKQEEAMVAKSIYFVLGLSSSCLLLNLLAENFPAFAYLFKNYVYAEEYFFQFPYPHSTLRYNLGGVPLYYLYKDIPTVYLQRMLSDFGVGLTSSITLIVSFFLLTQIDLPALLQKLKQQIYALFDLMKRKPQEVEEDAPLHSMQEIAKTLTKYTPKPLYTKPEQKQTPQPKSINLGKKQAAIRAQKIANGDFTLYRPPALTLLNNPKKVDQPSLKKELKKQAEILEETLMSFGIEAKVGEINCGPTITSFEVHPAVGVKVQKIKTLENDIALNLQAKSIRIIAPIPGKAAVGVEIPSLYPQAVSFKELLAYYQQNPKKMLIPLLLGKTVSGDAVISDLAKMPHCLIAGATGSGKSVCINTIIMSILMNASPDDVKLMMIDPKKVELTPYTNLPHMIAPVITEAHGAYAALNWLVKEMQNRYELLKQLGLRNIASFNHRQINPELEASLNTPVPQKLPFIVAIIDEFADLMMASSSDLETPIARIAQMARAVGIHLILATQRPSREVITGLIKANFPTRIAFKVANRINSQIIIDDVGAESLLGNGDMLFLPPGTSSLIRSQGVYISDEEIHRIIGYLCEQAPPNYLIKSFDTMQFDGAFSGKEREDSPKDTLYDQALSLVVETNTASTTFLQRKLKIGYARAASLMDELEIKGVISSQEGAKPRRILVKSSPLDTPETPKESDEEEIME